MIHDLDQFESHMLLEADVCIIGSGAAGITIALEFLNTSHRVVVLEGGGAEYEKDSQEPYQSEVVGLAHGGVNEGRARALGGTTLLWAGQALPLCDIDFEARPWVPYSGWPIAKQTLTPFYARAETVMQIPAVTYHTDSWPRSKGSPPVYDPARFTPMYSQFTQEPNFARKYRERIAAAPNITLLTHANVTHLQAAPNANAVGEVLVQSFQGKKLRVRARFFIVCCGGIETARLLLASRSVEPEGIGNRNDVVGRFFQDHPGVRAGRVKPLDRRKFHLWCNAFRLRQGEYGLIRYGSKVRASDAWQREAQMLNVCGEIYYPEEENAPIAAAKQVMGVLTGRGLRDPAQKAKLPAALKQVARSPHKVAKATWQYYVLRQSASVGVIDPYLGIGCEQEPNPASRVTLSSQTDSLGMPRSILDWRLTGAETRTLERFLPALVQEWQTRQIGIVDVSGLQLPGREQGRHGGYVDASHHLGTARMGNDPKTSVVDSRCRVHDYANLYIGSSAVFPTGGFSNPTLTIIALCLRISDEIKSRLARPAIAV